MKLKGVPAAGVTTASRQTHPCRPQRCQDVCERDGQSARRIQGGEAPKKANASKATRSGSSKESGSTYPQTWSLRTMGGTDFTPRENLSLCSHSLISTDTVMLGGLSSAAVGLPTRLESSEACAFEEVTALLVKVYSC